MAKADALDVVVDELVYQQPLAIVKHRFHRASVDDNRLDKEHTEKDERNDDQKNIADQPERLPPEVPRGLTPHVVDLYAAVVRRGDHPEIVLVFVSKKGHNRKERQDGATQNVATVELSLSPFHLSKNCFDERADQIAVSRRLQLHVSKQRRRIADPDAGEGSRDLAAR